MTQPLWRVRHAWRLGPGSPRSTNEGAGLGAVGPGSGLRAVLPLALASGAVDASANVCYVLATRDGLFGIAVVITALYPGMTVLLARFVLGERMRLIQQVGLLLAGLGVILVTV